MPSATRKGGIGSRGPERRPLTAFNQADPVWVISDDTVYGDADDFDVISAVESFMFGTSD